MAGPLCRTARSRRRPKVPHPMSCGGGGSDEVQRTLNPQGPNICLLLCDPGNPLSSLGLTGWMSSRLCLLPALLCLG